MKNIFILVWLTIFSIQITAQSSSSNTITEMPWVEDFEEYNVSERPEGWTFPFLYEGYPIIGTHESQVLIIRSSTLSPCYAVTPVFAIPLNQLYVEYFEKHQYGFSSEVILGYMTNPDSTSTFVDVYRSYYNSSGFKRHQIKPFANLDDSIKGAIAIKVTYSFAWDTYFDNFRVDTIPFCAVPEPPIASEITPTSALITWDDPNEYNPLWNFFYREYESEDEWSSILGVIDSVALINLVENTTYEMYLTAHCVDRNDESERSDIVVFTTEEETEEEELILIPPTQVEHFNAVPPSGWEKKQGLLPASSNANLYNRERGWTVAEEGCGGNITNTHARLNIFTWLQSTCFEWLISPSIDLGQNNDTYQIEFDAQLTEWNTLMPPDTNGIDDRFAVVVSTDNGATWNASHATIWNNIEGNELIFNGLAIQQHVVIPLVDSAGTPYQGLIKVGFYGESSVANADNDLHIDNFKITSFVENRIVADLRVNIDNPNTAIINWEGDTEQYIIKYQETNEEFWIVDTTTLTEYAIEDLASETEYVAMVRCFHNMIPFAWDTVTFTTLVNPCTAPYNISTISNYPTSLDITWEGDAASYLLRYRHQNEAYWSTVTVNTNSYILENRISSSIYFVQVRSNCGSLLSDWAPENPYIGMTKISTRIEEKCDDEIALYPNPATTFITLVGHDIIIEKVEILDLSGRVLLQPIITDNTVNVESLHPGVYFIRIINNKKHTTFRFVKH